MAPASNEWDPVVDRVERWFIRRGVPHCIHEYQATTDVFTRMLPGMVLMLLAGALVTFGDQFKGWGQALAFGAAIMILLGAGALVNRIRHRPLMQLPQDVGLLEVGLYLTGGPLLALIFAESRRLNTALALFAINLALLIVGYVVTSYALFPMLRWGAKQMWREISKLARLVAKTLPLLLLFATFLFMNAEMWQVAHDISAPFYAIVIGSLLLAAVGFLAMRLPTEIATLQRFASWKQVREVAGHCGAPIDDLVTHGVKPAGVPLDRGERLNILVLMLTAKVVQMALVAGLIGAFYVAFGLLTIRQETLFQWTELDATNFAPLARFGLLGSEVVVTWELFAVSGFIAAISGLQFAVSLITDEVYRQDFSANIEEEVREVMAVRALYLSHMEGPFEHAA